MENVCLSIFLMIFAMSIFFCWSAYHKNDNRWNSRKQILQKYNVHQITTAQTIWTNFTQTQAYLLHQSYSKTSVELGPNFDQIIKQSKLNTTAQLLQGSSGARANNLVKFYKTNLLTTAQLLQDFSRAGTKIWSNYTTKKAYTTAQLLPDFNRARTKIWSKYTRKALYYSTDTPRLQWS